MHPIHPTALAGLLAALSTGLPVPLSTPEAGEVARAACGPGERAEGDAFPAPRSKPQPGDLVVSEFMSNPAAVPDAQGEWFELTNTLPWRLDLEGLVISDAGGDLFGLWNGGQGILVGPGASVVLGNNPDPGTNGGVAVDFAYTGFVLANTEDEIRVHTREGVLLDAVEYGADGAWPLEAGRSTGLDPGIDDPGVNDDPAHWCAATAPLPGGDSGSPGTPNEPCP